MKRILRKCLIALLFGISVLLVGLLIVASMEKTIYKGFYSRVEEGIAIRGLDTSYVPQGFCYNAQADAYLASGYMNDGSASRIYYVSGDERSEFFVELAQEEGGAFIGHIGGIASYGNHIWLASDDFVYHLTLESLLEAGDGSSVALDGRFETDLVPAFTFIHGGYLYVGEFYKKDKYETDASHHIRIDEETVNRALCYAYPMAEDGSVTFEAEFALSLPDMVQGMCITSSGRIAVSTSWGISNSHLKLYRNWKADSRMYPCGGGEIPLYLLSDACLEEDVALPPMSEELEYKDGRILINFESAGKKYKNVNIFRQDKILLFAAE